MDGWIDGEQVNGWMKVMSKEWWVDEGGRIDAGMDERGDG